VLGNLEDGPCSVTRRDGTVPLRLESLDDVVSEGVVILDDQNPSIAALSHESTPPSAGPTVSLADDACGAMKQELRLVVRIVSLGAHCHVNASAHHDLSIVSGGSRLETPPVSPTQTQKREHHDNWRRDLGARCLRQP